MSRIVIIDDALFVRYTMTKTLSMVGHDIVGEADNALDGLKLINREQPDLVILDLSLPGMDGLTALPVIRRHHPNVRVLVCSAHCSGPQGQDALARGADEILPKPYRSEDLVACVTSTLIARRLPPVA